MKKIAPVILSALTIGLLISCNSNDGVANDPRAVLVSFFERMSKKDVDGASRLVTKDSKSTMEMVKKGIAMAEKMKDDPNMKDSPSLKEDDPVEGFKDIQFGDAAINGSEATVPMKNLKKDQSFDFPLKKEGGSWKVDFSMATLMKMGMQEKARRGGDYDSTDFDKNYNLDSLQNGMKYLDSTLKTLDPEKMKQMKDAMKELEKLKQQ